MGLTREGFKKKPIDPLTLANAKTKEQIAFEVLAFIKRLPGKETSLTYEAVHSLTIPVPIHFWGYYADYDWVVFCQLFGRMIDLPRGFPMYCRDIKQLCDDLGNPPLPKQEKGEHNALEDARWNKMVYQKLIDFKHGTCTESSLPIAD